MIKNKENPQEPYELFGVECSSGWNDILRPIFEYIEKYNVDKIDDDKIIITQVKEKFGSLRVYCNFETDELSDMIQKAESDSWETCEFCGSKENIGHTSKWIMTICHDCIKKNAVKSGIEKRWRKYSDDTLYIISDKINEEDKAEKYETRV